MYKIINILLFILVITHYNDILQNDDESNIILTTYIPIELNNVPNGSRSNLEAKLDQVVSLNGLGGSSMNPRFIITPRVNILSKEITPTAPPMHAYSLEVVFSVGDGIEGTRYGTYSTNVKGVGRSEIQAFNSALRGIKPRDKGLSDFLNQSKQRIITYYSDKCETTLKQVDSMVGQNQFDEAIFILMDVPEVVRNCYDKSMEKAAQVYRQKQEYSCQVNLTKAKAALSQSNWSDAASHLIGYTPDMACYTQVSALYKQMQNDRCSSNLAQAKAKWASRNAGEAASYLALISNNSPCSNEASIVATDISQRLDDRERREWDLAYEKYDRNQTMREEKQDVYLNLEERMMNYQETKGHDLKLLQVQAAREVGVAFGENQPRKVSYNIRNW